MKAEIAHLEKVDITEAVRITGLNPQTVYRLARRKRIRSFKVLTRSVRFARSDLVKLLREQ